MSTITTEKSAGLQLMELIRDGDLPPPPAALLLGLEIDSVSEGAITFGFTSDDRFSNGATTHAGADVVTTNLSVSYLRPVSLTGRYRCEGRVVHPGRTLVHAEAVMTDASGRDALRATATCHVRLLPGPPQLTAA